MCRSDPVSLTRCQTLTEAPTQPQMESGHYLNAACIPGEAQSVKHAMSTHNTWTTLSSQHLVPMITLSQKYGQRWGPGLT